METKTGRWTLPVTPTRDDLADRRAVDDDRWAERPGTDPTPSLRSSWGEHFLSKVVEVAELTGVRLALVHAKGPTAAASYRHDGFEPSPIDDVSRGVGR